MNWKKTGSLIMVSLMVVFMAGCDLGLTSTNTNVNTKSQVALEEQMGVTGVAVGSSFFAEEKQTEVIQQGLMVANPIPEITKSLERENLAKRLELLNDNGKIFYVYLVSYGNVMAYYTAQGKVSSVNSKLTTSMQIVEDPFTRCYNGAYTDQGLTVESPDLDGSYGTNGDGIFFFTTAGAYVEWAGEYMVSDFPLRLSTPPRMIVDITEKVE